MPMKVLFCFIYLSLCVAIYAYISRILHNDIEDRDQVYQLLAETKNAVNDSPDNIFWFVQVSDIHISRYYDFDRGPDLKQFCDSHLSIIKPEFVIASGDLTDAKFADKLGSMQYVDEWEKYHDAVVHCQKTVKIWLDLRGNHDAFDTPDHDHKSNLFRLYSAQGKIYPSSYVYHHKKKFGRYSFVAVDATPNPGPKRPFNFFGYIKQDGEELVHRYLNECRSSNITMAFGHYPTSLIATQTGNSIRHILRNVTAYLCGHLHTMAGMVPRMYARHRTGMLELELGDWKDERIYRVLAIDHDMLSIADGRQGQWPVVMVTNPKQASLVSPQHEPLQRMVNSTHIRILVFTQADIYNIGVYIDDIYQGNAHQSQGPLYVLPWKPTQFKSGLHTIRLVIKDSSPTQHIHEQVFSLDHTSPLLPLKGRFILMMDLAFVAQTVFYLMVTVYVGVLTLLRKCNNVKIHFISNPPFLLHFVCKFYNQWLYRMWLFARATRLFYCLVGFIVYVALGPWFIGECIEGSAGVVFVWGMYVHGTYLPVCLTYIYGIFQILTFNVPMTLYLGYYLHYTQLSSTKTTLWHYTRHIYIPLVALVVFQTYIALSEFPAAYGTKAFVIGPVRTGSVILACVTYYIARQTNVAALLAKHVK